MIEAFEPGKPIEGLSSGRPFGVIGHSYQPHREAYLPASDARLSIVPAINEKIFQQVYKPILVEEETIPRGLVFSFYPGLRDWLKGEHPHEFHQIVEKINALPNKEYQVLGDPYIHLIMPLQPREDQDMLIKLGKRAFEADLGFQPKGIWLPETAASATTLEVASDNGYEFLVLRDSQLKGFDSNPIKVETGKGRTISVIHFNSNLSGYLSFDDEASSNVDIFLDNTSRLPAQAVLAGSDIELYGHHKKDRDKFLKYLETPGVLENHGFVPLDAKAVLSKMNGQISEVWENSSWSCDHALGRWTGECDCDNANERVRSDKESLYETLDEYGKELNSRLDSNPAWREQFIDFFLKSRGEMFNSNQRPQVLAGDERFWAKYCELVGKTSCGWFFGKENSPEREIPERMIKEIEKLIPDISEHTIFQNVT